MADVAAYREILASLLRLMDACLDATVKHRKGELSLAGQQAVLRVTPPLIHVAGISGHSLLTLTQEVGLGVRDCYPIVRGIVEAAANVGFIMAEGAATAERAERHAKQKSFRDLERTWRTPSGKVRVAWTGTLPQAELDRLTAMTAEFSTKRGSEKSWTDTTLTQRIDRIELAFPKVDTVLLVSAALMVYRNASEVVHGSYFGALYFYGVTSPRPEKPDLRAAMEEHQATVLLSAIITYGFLIACFAEYTGLQWLGAAAGAELKKLHKLVDPPGGEPPAS